MFEIFDVEKIAKKMTDKLFAQMKIDEDEKMSPRAKRTFRWIGERLPVHISGFLVAITTFYIFNLIYKNFGIDYIIMIGVLIMIFNLKNINKSLKKLTE